jgi:prepilin-type N-terminal cleavage/methylation domain-containing protein
MEPAKKRGPVKNPRHRLPQWNAGYSLAEMLIVIAIIGVLSLISVPAFLSFQRANTFKSSARNFSADLRAARAMAIQQSFDVRVEVTTGTSGPGTYTFYFTRDGGTTWTPLQLKGSQTTAGTATTAGRNVRKTDPTVWFPAVTIANFQDVDADNDPDIIFKPSGMITLGTNVTNANLTLRTDWSKLATTTYTVSLTSSGQIRLTTMPQCSDGLDNDGDGKIDFGGAGTNDPQCSGVGDNNEAS